MVCALLVCGGLLQPTSAWAQETMETETEKQPVRVVIVEEAMPEFKNRISFNPLGMLFGIGSFTWEHNLSDSVALAISPSGFYFGFDENKVYGATLGLGLAFFLNDTAPTGLRASIQVSPGFMDATNADEGVFSIGATALFGYTWVWRNGFTMGLSGGVQYLYFDLPNTESALDGILPAIDWNLGFVF
jgi:hypothetical protein